MSGETARWGESREWGEGGCTAGAGDGDEPWAYFDFAAYDHPFRSTHPALGPDRGALGNWRGTGAPPRLWFLSGHEGSVTRSLAEAHPVGILARPGNAVHRQAWRYDVWGIDNGAYAPANPDRPFDLDGYLRWLEGLDPDRRATCLFATAPDRWASFALTWERSRPALAAIRDLGYPVGLCAQDGMEAWLAEERIPWAEFDTLFVGGSDAWRSGPGLRAVLTAAQLHVKWVHVGRVSTLGGLRWAVQLQAHSVDSTLLAHGPRANGPILASFLERVLRQPPLPFWGRAPREGRYLGVDPGDDVFWWGRSEQYCDR